MLSTLIALLIFVIVCGIVLYILQRYVAPAFPPPFRVWFMAVCGLIAIVILIAIVYPNAPVVR